MKTLAILLAAMLPLSAFAQVKKEKPKLVEPTAEELKKLGGFEPAPKDEDFSPKNLQIELMVVSLPDADAAPLLETLRAPEKVDAGYQEVLALIKSKKAKIISAPTVTTKSGNRAVTENITEVRYAIEFNPGEAAGKPVAKDGADAKTPPGPKVPPAQGVVPTTFETRNAGVTLEIEPVIGPDGKTIDAQLSAQHVQLLGWDSATVKQDQEIKVSIPQPRFHTNKVTQSFSLVSGQRLLIGSFRAGGEEDRMELFLLKTSVVRAKAANK